MTKLAWKSLAVLAGLALFGWYLSRVDLRSVGAALGRLGWMAPVVLVPYFCVYVVDCFGWRLTFPRGFSVPFRTLFRIRWAGEAVNNVVPSAHVGGEAAKIYLLRKHGIPATVSTPPAVVSKTAQTIAQLLFVLLGAAAFLWLGSDQPGWRAGMALVLAGAAGTLLTLLWIQRRGLFATIADVARVFRVGSAFLEKRRTHIAEVDRTITRFYRDHRPRFYASTAIYFGGWALDTVEIYLVAHLMGMPVTWTQALAVEAFTSVAKVLGMWVPGSLGVQDSGIVLLGRMAGLPEALSVAYALLRRMRELIFALVGWFLLWNEETNLRMIRAEASAVISETRVD